MFTWVSAYAKRVSRVFLLQKAASSAQLLSSDSYPIPHLPQKYKFFRFFCCCVEPFGASFGRGCEGRGWHVLSCLKDFRGFWGMGYEIIQCELVRSFIFLLRRLGELLQHADTLADQIVDAPYIDLRSRQCCDRRCGPGDSQCYDNDSFYTEGLSSHSSLSSHAVFKNVVDGNSHRRT